MAVDNKNANNRFRMSVIKDEPSKEQSGGNPSLSVSQDDAVSPASMKNSDNFQRDQQTFLALDERM